jgi:hypothetical protein
VSAAWKDLERRVCRALGSNRRPTVDGAGGWARGSDDDGTCIFALEIKRSTRPQLRQTWLDQARRNARETNRPWLLVQRERHGSPRLIATLDFYDLVHLAQQAGLLDEIEIRATVPKGLPGGHDGAASSSSPHETGTAAGQQLIRRNR